MTTSETEILFARINNLAKTVTELQERLHDLDMNYRGHFHRIDEIKTGGSLIVRREVS